MARQGDLTSLSSLSVALCRECGRRGQRQGRTAPRQSPDMKQSDQGPDAAQGSKGSGAATRRGKPTSIGMSRSLTEKSSKAVKVDLRVFVNLSTCTAR